MAAAAGSQRRRPGKTRGAGCIFPRSIASGSPPPKKGARSYSDRRVTEEQKQPSPPLAGLRVVDFSMNLPGPYATMILRSLGAEVIKVEPPRGDTARMFGRLFDIVNAGKKSVVLDLKDAGGQELARALVATSDIVVEGFRPGVMARLGVCPTELRARDPRLVVCSISGFGQHGPARDHAGHDLNFQALSGVCHMMRDADGRAMGAALPLADLSAAMTAVPAILAAIIRRQTTAEGEHIDVAMVDTLLSWAYVWAEGLTPPDARLSAATEPTAAALSEAAEQLPSPLRGLVRRGARALRSRLTASTIDVVGERLKATRRYEELTRQRLHALPHYAVYRTADDRYLAVGIVDEDKFWRALCEALGVGRLGRIPLLGRFVASAPLRGVLARAFAQQDLEHWLAVLDPTKIPIAPVLSLAQALEQPQLRQRRPRDGHVHAPWPLAYPLTDPPPRLGADDDSVLGPLR